MEIELLRQLVGTPRPAGDEAAAARLWRGFAQPWADEVRSDVRGNSLAILHGGPLRVLLDGHLDEIGLMTTYVDADGFLRFNTIGGWDGQVLVGQRVVLQGRDGPVRGVVGRPPIHLLKGPPVPAEVEELWIDIGAKDKAEALTLVRVGATAVVDGELLDFPNGRLVARGLDNAAGAFVVIEALHRLAEDRPTATVAAVASVHEEIGGAGARAATFAFDPQVALVVDVTYTTDDPGGDKRQYGEVSLGTGPVLGRGAANSPVLYDMLLELAEREGIPHTLQHTPKFTGTNAESIHHMRGGVATAVVSIPLRYMHSPCEMIQVDDLEQTVRLIVAFVRTLHADTDFVPR